MITQQLNFNNYLISTIELKPNEKLILCGEEYNLNFSNHIISQRMNRIYKKIGNIQNLYSRILFLLTQVEEFVINEIKIGEEFAIFDEILKISFAVVVSLDEVTIITVFDEPSNRAQGITLKLFEGEKVLCISAEDVHFFTFNKEKKRIIPDISI